ncbi:uncharacterized protein EI90DRAFT_3101376 [Cantharellus anzutake]|uniref:uncharacterized protein n=1 Tax=Cantharellus anzutake TaxID=1750568 RepID=UPI0019066A01|nr:uncharacterized protein EI90DRAFT_3101376 [Cantharellus anzutake]KAF8310436.1 hypothetical protein EI90DRAFT_3101376 [Cantharellus anzutake]
MAQRYVEAESQKPVQHYSLHSARLLHWFLLLIIFCTSESRGIICLDLIHCNPQLNEKRSATIKKVSPIPLAVFVPYAKIASYGGLRPMLYLRSLQPPYGHARQTCLKLGKALVEEGEKRLTHALKPIQQALAQDENRALQDLKDVLPKNEEDEARNIPTISQERTATSFSSELRRGRTRAWRRSVGDSQVVKDQIATIIAEIHEVFETPGLRIDRLCRRF